MPLLDVKDVTVTFPIRSPILRRQTGAVHAVRGVDLSVDAGETLAVVGESGSGKSTLARAIGRLVRATGTVMLDGSELLSLPSGALREARRNIQYVFQDPYSSLNRRWTIGACIAEPLQAFGIGTRQQRRETVANLLTLVGLDPGLAARLPRALSGGQRQRVGIARALALNPKLVVCDEAISALDVSVQAQVLNLLQALREQMDLAYLFITHDLGVVRRFARRVAVMHAGKIVELSTTAELFQDPLHPYTAALLSSVPRLDQPGEGAPPRMRLVGGPPSPLATPPGCLFATRCPVATLRCHAEAPPLREAAPGRKVACHRVEGGVATWRHDPRNAEPAQPNNRIHNR